MTCWPINDPKSGIKGFACARSLRPPKPKQCSFCPAKDAELLCDAELERVRHPRKDGSTTCDAVMCHRCGSEIGPDRHHCPKHRTKAGDPFQLGLL